MTNKVLDLRNVVCPMNFVKTKVFLEDIKNGETIEIILDEGDPLVNVTRSLKEEGHLIVKVEQFSETTFKVYLKKGLSK